MPETVYSVQLVGTGRTMIVFGSMIHAQSFSEQYNAFYEPESEKLEAEVKVWTVLANAHKFHPKIVPGTTARRWLRTAKDKDYFDPQGSHGGAKT